jgi:hypothetical protein
MYFGTVFQEVDSMEQNTRSLNFKLFVVGALAVCAILISVACGKAEAPKPAAEQVVAKAPAELSVNDEIVAVLGRAEAQVSGVFDVQTAAEGIAINYHHYLLQADAFDTDFPKAIAPKIRDLFAKVKSLDRVTFDVSIPTESAEVWKPMLHFAVTRKLIEETDWTKLLDADFFQIVLDLKHLD